MLFWVTTQGIPRVLTPILSHNSRDTFRATTQGTQQSHLWSITKSLVDHAYRFNKPMLQQQNRLVGDTCRQAHNISDSSSLQVPPGDKNLTARRIRPNGPLLDSYRLTASAPPPSAVSVIVHFCCWVILHRFCSSNQASIFTIFSPITQIPLLVVTHYQDTNS